MTAGRPAQGTPWTPAAHSAQNEQLYGAYLGIVTHTRTQDLWIRVNIPQILGDQDSNWARPIGFNSAGSPSPPVASVAGEPEAPLAWGGFPAPYQQYPGQPVGWSPHETGPGPAVNSLVVVLFLGGDRNRPGYLLTSQHVG